MNKKIINDFIKKNFFKISYKNSKKKILLIDRGRAQSAIMNSFFSYRLNKIFLFDIDLVNNFSKKNFISKIYKSFGIEKNININIKNNFTKIGLIFIVNVDFFFSTIKIFF